MSNFHESPFNEFEERYLLAEILKTSSIHPDVLSKLINDANIEPLWLQIALPLGRSVSSCQNAFSALQSRLPQPDPKAKKSKRPLSMGEMVSAPGRSIQPRPSASAFAPINPNGQDQLSPGEGDGRPRKKRGRPSKVEHEQRVREAEARGEIYPPPRKPKPSRPSLESGPSSAGAGAPMAIMFTPNNAGFQAVTSPGSAYQKYEPERPAAMKPPGVSMPLMEQSHRSPFVAERAPRSTIPETQMSDYNTSESLISEMRRQAAQAETQAERVEKTAQEAIEVLGREPTQELVQAPTQDPVQESAQGGASMQESAVTESTATIQGSYASGPRHSLPDLYSGPQS